MTVIVVLLIISIATTIANMLIIYKLNLLPGQEFFEYNPNTKELHLNRETYIKSIQLEQNTIEDVRHIVGNSELTSGQSSFKIDENGIKIDAPFGFEVRSPSTGKRLYPFDITNITNQLLETVETLSIPNGIRDVFAIRPPKDGDLSITGKNINIRGNKGVHLTSKQIDFSSSSIFLSSINGTIQISGKKGLYLNMESFKNKIVTRNNVTNGKAQNILCICAKNGRIFKMPIKDSNATRCDDARFPQSENPCT